MDTADAEEKPEISLATVKTESKKSMKKVNWKMILKVLIIFIQEYQNSLLS